jgi:hypothetical protein
MVVYNRRCRDCRDGGRRLLNKPRDDGGGDDRDEWMLRRHIGVVYRMQMEDIVDDDDVALRGSGILCTERTADITEDKICDGMFFSNDDLSLQKPGGDQSHAFTTF